MIGSTRRLLRIAVAASVLLAVLPTAAAFLPLLAGMGKQILQDMIFDGVKSQLLGSLAQMGCKGARLASLWSAAERTSLLARAPLGGAVPPSGVTPPAGATGPVMPETGSLGALANAARPVRRSSEAVDRANVTVQRAQGLDPTSPGSLPTAGRTVAMAGQALGGSGFGAGGGPQAGTPDVSALLATMSQQAGSGEDSIPPDAMRNEAAMIAGLQQAMTQPLSRADTLAVFGELKDMGVLTEDLFAEARDCIALMPPSGAQAIGAAGAVMKSMVLPQLYDLRARLGQLSPEDQSRLATEMGAALREADGADRKAFREGLGRGFFPSAVLEQLRASGALD